MKYAMRSLAHRREYADQNLALLPADGGRLDKGTDRRQTVLIVVTLLGLLLLVCGTVDIPHQIEVHSRSLSGTITACAATGSMLGAITQCRRVLRNSWALFALTTLLLLAILRAGRDYYGDYTLQQSLVYVAGLGIVAIVASAPLAKRHLHALRRYLTASFLLADGLYASVLVQHGPNGYGIVTPRIFAITGALATAWWLGNRTNWRWRSWLLALSQVLLVALSMSRTATAACLALVLFAAVRDLGWRGRTILITGTLLAAFSAGLALFAVPQLHDRMFTTRAHGHGSFHFLGLTVQGNGRSNLWNTSWEYFLERPLLGHGIGAASAHIKQVYGTLEQPEQDYLRVLDDVGAVGFAGAGVLLLAFTIQIHGRSRPAHAEETERDKSAASLGCVSVMILMLTDNPIIYISCVAPLAVMVGLAARSVFPGVARSVVDVRAELTRQEAG